MSLAEELRWVDAVGTADLVRAREVTAREVVEAAAARMDAARALNAVTLDLVDRALAAAEAPLPDGPLAGAPLLLKDLGGTLAGVPETMGSRATRGWVPDFTVAPVQAYLDAGLLITGKTNTPEWGNYCATESELLGVALNPWDPLRSPGGSSGGSAVAVAAGVAPAASGGDGTGSIRVPASCCGVVGLKPARGRVSVAPDGQWMDGLAVLHALTRTVRDSAALLDVVARPVPGDPYGAAAPGGSFMQAAVTPPRSLRILLALEPPFPGPVDPAVRAAVERVARLLADLGHEVDEGTPRLGDPAAARHAVAVLHGVANVALHRFATEVLGRPPAPDELEPVTWEMVRLGEQVTGLQHSDAIDVLHQQGRSFATACDGYDVLLCPTLNVPPPPLGTVTKARGSVDAFFDAEFALTGWTAVANIAGCAAISLPLGQAEGVPVGVQLMAPGEAILLSLAAQLEQAAPWADFRPVNP
jgi:amidase